MVLLVRDVDSLQGKRCTLKRVKQQDCVDCHNKRRKEYNKKYDKTPKGRAFKKVQKIAYRSSVFVLTHCGASQGGMGRSRQDCCHLRVCPFYGLSCRSHRTAQL